MHHFSLSEIAGILDGTFYVPDELRDFRVALIATDSRQIQRESNALFFALKGPVNNGHKYIPELLEKGIRAFVISEKQQITADAAFILVENTTQALQKLAAFNRHLFSVPVIGITGSNGKTIVKEWLHDLLSEDFRVAKSPKSYNSQVGVPLSVLLMGSGHELGIFEAGISQPGEMKNLQPVIDPGIGIFTNIGDAHQEFFTSIEQKIGEKLLLFSNSKKLICRTDHPVLAEKAKAFCEQHSIEKFFWSTKNSTSVLFFEITKQMKSSTITAYFNNKTYDFIIPFTDESAIENACHCFAGLMALELDPANYLRRFAELRPVAMRLEIKQGINNCILINDFYNSDLNSLAIALSALKQQATGESQKKIIILSDIEQTGLPNDQLYTQVNRLLVEWKIDQVCAIGPEISKRKNLFSIPVQTSASAEEFEHGFVSHEFQSAAVLIKGARRFRFERISALLQQKAHQTVLEINLNALVNNLNIFRKSLKPSTKIMGMVKAFSYGSGDVEIARVLQYQKVDYLAVAVADEGVQLRNAGIVVPIVVMNPEQDSFQNIINYRLEPNIYSLELLEKFSESVAETGIRNFPVHIKIDTGMNRLGFKERDELDRLVEHLKKSDVLKIQSVFSHLAASDEEALDDFTRGQFQKFEETSAWLGNALQCSFERHILNSAGIERFPEKQYEMVRLGIGLYGISQLGLPLENIGTLKSTVSQVKKVNREETVGYNRKGKVNRESKVAIVPVGYADGLDRKLGNRSGFAFINNSKVPIIGNICMDMLMLDVTDLEVKSGDTVEFFGPHISISELAEKIGTIPYEILTGISQRVKRVYLQE